MRYPYTKSQINAAVNAHKNPRDWEPLAFEKSGDDSRRCDAQLEREDGKEDRMRLIVRAGRLDKPQTYASSLLLEDEKVRGVDYHAIERRYFYREVIPKGWHEDVIDPNKAPGEKGHHERVALEGFDPTDLKDFVSKSCKKWTISLPPADDSLL